MPFLVTLLREYAKHKVRSNSTQKAGGSPVYIIPIHRKGAIVLNHSPNTSNSNKNSNTDRPKLIPRDVSSVRYGAFHWLKLFKR